MKKWIFGSLVSLLAIYFLLQNFDMKEFSRIQGKIRWEFLGILWASSLWSFVLFSYRWYLLLDKRVSFWGAYSSSVIGVGMNMVLPARGGDVVRLVINKKSSGLGLPNLVSKLFLEKVMDLGTVVCIGALSIFLLGLGSQKNFLLVFVSGSVILGMIFVLVLIRYFLQPLISLLDWFAKFLKLSHFLKEKIVPQLEEFSGFLRGDKLWMPFLISFPTWVVGYALYYYLVGVMIGMEFSLYECLLFVFVGAMGVAVPSAPSGIGVFHASIISGFLLLGKEAGEGFVYATVLHLTQFGMLTISALVLWLALQFKKDT